MEQWGLPQGINPTLSGRIHFRAVLRAAALQQRIWIAIRMVSYRIGLERA